MTLEQIKTPQDVYDYMEETISYGWMDKYNKRHLMDMKGFRSLYRTMSSEEVLEQKIGICIEQVYLMHQLLDQINVTNKMFCCRVFEPDDYGNLEEEEHMHCFLLYYLDDHVYHLEHPNFKTKGIHTYNTEQEAVDHIVSYYKNLRGGMDSPTTEFFDVEKGLSFRQFNAYINQIEKLK